MDYNATTNIKNLILKAKKLEYLAEKGTFSNKGNPTRAVIINSHMFLKLSYERILRRFSKYQIKIFTS